MHRSEIERFLFRGENPACALAHIDFRNHEVRIRLQPWADGPNDPIPTVQALFPSAEVESIEEEEEERESWPLDIIGFDCYRDGERWEFVLHCNTVEWCWRSGWPTAQTIEAKSQG
jgi:hypothetical protein